MFKNFICFLTVKDSAFLSIRLNTYLGEFRTIVQTYTQGFEFTNIIYESITIKNYFLKEPLKNSFGLITKKTKLLILILVLAFINLYF